MHVQVLLLVLCLGAVFGKYHLVWKDEFDGNKLKDENWFYETGCGLFNSELQCYTAHREKNARVKNGHLVIDAQVEDYEGHHFTSARIHTKAAWKYGKFEIRARMPRGHHLWPAIWMFPRDSKYGGWAASGEIDIMEYRGDKPEEILGTIHYGGAAPNNIHSGSGERHFNLDFSKDFHVYGLEWHEHNITWTVDGKAYHTENINRNMWSGKGPNPYTKNGQPFDQPFYIILNVAVGGTFFGPGPYVTPAEARKWHNPTLEVDYVRVYQ